MPVRAKKLPPALKHGGYSAMTLLPGEDRAAFDDLLRELIAEYAPGGVFEEDTVYELARLLWRKRNLNIFRIAERARDHYTAIQFQLRPSTKGLLNLDGVGSEEDASACRAAEEQARRELEDLYQLVEIGKAATLAGLMEELAAEERLNTQIYGCIKRLLLWRGLRSVSSKSPGTPPLSISGPKKTA